jgi:phage-related baseplate assembly protein
MAEIIPEVFEEAIQPKLKRIQQRLEVSLGRALAPADIEMLIVNAFVYELQLFCIAGNQAFRQNLTRFASGIMLDYIGEMVSVKRLPASSAACTIEFNLVPGHNAVQIPAGIRIQSIDGNVIFKINSAIDVPIGTDTVTVTALCQTPGVIGNDYDAGKISIILDPQPFLTDAANTDATAGGSDAESDAQLRSRINLAPSSFSVAGPSGAYKYFAKSAHPTIVDVESITTNPGEITIYPLCADGTLPSEEIKEAVLAILDDEKVRPQNDTVLVDDPTVVEYAIVITLTTYSGAVNDDVIAEVTANLTAFKEERNNRLGMDVIVAQLSALSVIKDKVYKPVVVSPSADIIADRKTYPKCTGITVTITGSNNG